jgi:hypothetical protein
MKLLIPKSGNNLIISTTVTFSSTIIIGVCLFQISLFPGAETETSPWMKEIRNTFYQRRQRSKNSSM